MYNSCMPHALHDQLAVQSPVNRLNGYSIQTALGFASGVTDELDDHYLILSRPYMGIPSIYR